MATKPNKSPLHVYADNLIDEVSIAEELRVRNKIEMARNLIFDRIASSLEKIVQLIPNQVKENTHE